MLLESISLDSMESDKGENLKNSGTMEGGSGSFQGLLSTVMLV